MHIEIGVTLIIQRLGNFWLAYLRFETPASADNHSYVLHSVYFSPFHRPSYWERSVPHLDLQHGFGERRRPEF